MKGKSSFELASKMLWSIYHFSQITLEGKLIFKKKTKTKHQFIHLFHCKIPQRCSRRLMGNTAPCRSPSQKSLPIRLPGEQDLPYPVGSRLQNLLRKLTDFQTYVKIIKNMEGEFLVYKLYHFPFGSHLYFSLPRLSKQTSSKCC